MGPMRLSSGDALADPLVGAPLGPDNDDSSHRQEPRSDSAAAPAMPRTPSTSIARQASGSIVATPAPVEKKALLALFDDDDAAPAAGGPSISDDGPSSDRAPSRKASSSSASAAHDLSNGIGHSGAIAEPPPLSAADAAKLARALYETFTHTRGYTRVMRALDDFIMEQQIAIGERKANGMPIDAGEVARAVCRKQCRGFAMVLAR